MEVDFLFSIIKSKEEKIIGSLGKPSKMPGPSWGINPRTCITGKKLRKIADSVCSKCYAFKGNYRWPVVHKMQAKRLDAWQKNPFWKYYMVQLIKQQDCQHFRWFDSGDLINLKMLKDITWIAEQLKTVRFWLPTRETKIIKQFLKNHKFPRNLCVRISATMIGQKATKIKEHRQYSSVSAGIDFKCPAKKQNNQCLNCRACWTKKITNIDYTLH